MAVLHGSLTRLTPIVAPLSLALVITASVLPPRLDARFVDASTREDGIVESCGASAPAVGAVVSFAAFRRAGRLRSPSRPALLKRLSYLAFGLFLFVALGEEIGWRQRLLGVETPDAIRRVNAQAEMNLHGMGATPTTDANQQVFKAVWVGLGVVIPVVAVTARRVRVALGRFVPVLPLWLALLFVGQQLHWKPCRPTGPPIRRAGTARIAGRIGEDAFRVEARQDARAARHVTRRDGRGHGVRSGAPASESPRCSCSPGCARRRRAVPGRPTATLTPSRRGGRAVECAGLESPYRARYLSQVIAHCTGGYVGT
ncbi:MAG TPA: hypothetical protein VN213_16385 [Solirubrobacteraceae bacterium]|nr:hypothetical protein [Solirubrobacteraceae bacterium]